MDPTNENSSAISSDLIRGHINTIILRTLYDGDKYGYEIINEIEEKSKGQYSLKQPTLYSALKRLESMDYVTSYWGGVSNGGRRKYFQITDKGKKIVEQNLAEWEYSRTVIDSLISEKDYDFNNPPPSAVDFSLLKKSTTRISTAGGDLDHDDIDLTVFESPEGGPADKKEDKTEESLSPAADTPSESIEEEHAHEDTPEESAAPQEPNDAEPAAAEAIGPQTVDEQPAEDQEPEAETEARQNAEQAAAARSSYAYTESYAQDTSSSQEAASSVQAEHDVWIDEEQRRIQHENYRNLVGDEEDATSYYYAQVARSNREQAARQAQVEEPVSPEPDSVFYSEDTVREQTEAYEEPPQANYYDEPYDENRAISSEILYSNRSPAERNYKDLLSRLYDNAQPEPEDYYAEEETQEPAQPQYEELPQPEPVPPADQYQTAPPEQAPPSNASSASNVEFYDIQEQAENDGIRITTSNGARNRTTAAKNAGNVFDKGKALFMSALYVFIVALAESIINLCIRGAIDSNAAYVIIPFVATFVMFGVFLFLYLRGYGKNSRKTQSRSYLSASLIIFVDLIIVIVLIAYFIIDSINAPVNFVHILKYAILPVIFAFNIPLFAIFYNYNSNRQ